MMKPNHMNQRHSGTTMGFPAKPAFVDGKGPQAGKYKFGLGQDN